jgi:hypothetical protein
VLGDVSTIGATIVARADRSSTGPGWALRNSSTSSRGSVARRCARRTLAIMRVATSRSTPRVARRSPLLTESPAWLQRTVLRPARPHRLRRITREFEFWIWSASRSSFDRPRSGRQSHETSARSSWSEGLVRLVAEVEDRARRLVCRSLPRVFLVGGNYSPYVCVTVGPDIEKIKTKGAADLVSANCMPVRVPMRHFAWTDI